LPIKKPIPLEGTGLWFPWYHPSLDLVSVSPPGHSKTLYRCQPPRLTGISGGPLPGEFWVLLPPDSHQPPALSGRVSLLLPFLAEFVMF